MFRAALACSGLRCDLRFGHELTEVASIGLGALGRSAADAANASGVAMVRNPARLTGLAARLQGIEVSQRNSSNLHIFFVHRVDHPHVPADDDRMRILISLRLEFPLVSLRRAHEANHG